VVERLLDALPVRASLPTSVLAGRVGLPTQNVESLLEPLLANGLVERRADGWRITSLGRQPTARPLDRSAAGG
jgi:DNA processing protein